MSETKMAVLGAQLALWFRDRLLNPENLLPQVRETMKDVFDQPPTVLPVPNNPDLDYAQVVILDSSHGVRLAISRKRGDLWINGQAYGDIDSVEQAVAKLGRSCFALLEGQSIVRVGYVVRFLYSSQQATSAIEQLLARRPSELQTGQTFDVGVMYVTRHPIGSRTFNDRTEVGQYHDGGDTAGISGIGVQVTRDFNSLPEDNALFPWSDVETLIQQSKTLFSLDQVEALMWKNQ